MNVGYDNPATMHLPLQAAIIELPRAHVIMVNASGQRFGNENTFQDYATPIRAYDSKARRMKNLPCWMVFDSNYVERWGFANHPPGSAPDWAPSASDISTLASKVGIDPAGLSATIERFNQFAETGIDSDFGRAPTWAMAPTGGTGKNPGLAAIERPPFYAVRLRPSLQGGSVGLKGDTKSRVLDWEDNPVPGLYAAGDVVLHDELGTGYQAGLTYASCLTFGYLAAQAIKSV
jgi:3-oxosteroid 1-dehydrogenase